MLDQVIGGSEFVQKITRVLASFGSAFLRQDERKHRKLNERIAVAFKYLYETVSRGTTSFVDDKFRLS
jgi:uncharacterized membrane-anchored protein YjiN (DUF445 family)